MRIINNQAITFKFTNVDYQSNIFIYPEYDKVSRIFFSKGKNQRKTLKLRINVIYCFFAYLLHCWTVSDSKNVLTDSVRIRVLFYLSHKFLTFPIIEYFSDFRFSYSLCWLIALKNKIRTLINLLNYLQPLEIFNGNY